MSVVGLLLLLVLGGRLRRRLRLCSAAIVVTIFEKIRVVLEECPTIQNGVLSAAALALLTQRLLHLLLFQFFLQLRLLSLLSPLFPREECLLGNRGQAIGLQRQPLLFNLLLYCLFIHFSISSLLCLPVRFSFLLWDDNITLRKTMTILAFQATIGTHPSPSVRLIFDRVQKKLTSDDRVHRHVISVFARVNVEVNFLLIIFNDFALLAFEALRTLK